MHMYVVKEIEENARHAPFRLDTYAHTCVHGCAMCVSIPFTVEGIPTIGVRANIFTVKKFSVI